MYLSIQLFSSLIYFSPKLFCFLVIQLLVCLCAFSHYLLVEFLRCFGMFCLVCVVLPCLHIFCFLSFALALWFINLSCIVCFICVAFSFLSQLFPASSLSLIIFISYRIFLIYISSRISKPSFEFPFMIFKGTISLIILLISSYYSYHY